MSEFSGILTKETPRDVLKEVLNECSIFNTQYSTSNFPGRDALDAFIAMVKKAAVIWNHRKSSMRNLIEKLCTCFVRLLSCWEKFPSNLFYPFHNEDYDHGKLLALFESLRALSSDLNDLYKCSYRNLFDDETVYCKRFQTSVWNLSNKINEVVSVLKYEFVRNISFLARMDNDDLTDYVKKEIRNESLTRMTNHSVYTFDIFSEKYRHTHLPEYLGTLDLEYHNPLHSVNGLPDAHSALHLLGIRWSTLIGQELILSNDNNIEEWIQIWYKFIYLFDILRRNNFRFTRNLSNLIFVLMNLIMYIITRMFSSSPCITGKQNKMENITRLLIIVSNSCFFLSEIIKIDLIVLMNFYKSLKAWKRLISNTISFISIGELSFNFILIIHFHRRVRDNLETFHQIKKMKLIIYSVPIANRIDSRKRQEWRSLFKKHKPTRASLRSKYCPICLGKVNKPVLLDCSHVFCGKCLRTWFQKELIRRNLKTTAYSCPKCRGRVKEYLRGRGIWKMRRSLRQQENQ